MHIFLPVQVTHRTMGGGGETHSSPTLGLTSRTFQLKDLQPSTEYQVCVHGLTRSLAQPLHQPPPPPHARAHTVAAVYDREQVCTSARLSATFSFDYETGVLTRHK